MQSRRTVLIGVSATIGFGTALSADTLSLPDSKTTLSPAQAYRFAKEGELTLLDIRRPDEWAKTGSAKAGHRLDMRKRDFIQKLDVLVDGDRSKPIAVICARGVRSRRLSLALAKAGYTRIIDIPEGMLGSRAGAGWIKRGLPVVR